MTVSANAFDITLARRLDDDGNPGVLGKCEVAEVYRYARTTKLVVPEVKHHVTEVLTEWLRQGVLATELVARHFCRAAALRRSEARCAALANGAGERLRSKRVRDPEYPESCWIWTGAATESQRNPQPKMALKGTAVSVSRAAVELAYGVLPEGVQTYNICGNSLCVEPSHQGARPQRWNVQGASRPRGVFCGASRITFDIAQAIRGAYEASPRRVRGGSGVSLAELADQYGISISAVRLILQGQTWRQPDEGGGADGNTRTR